ncbi:MAG: hypothetical protein ACK5L3_05770 [Oscillospiraceae bacterium]
MNENTIITYETASRKAVFKFESDFWIDNIDNVSGVDINISTTTGINQVGAKISAQQVQPKALTVTGSIHGAIETNRSALLRTIAPQVGAKLSVTQGEVTYYIEGSPQRTPIFSDGEGVQEFQFVLYCPVPYWKTKNNITTPFKSTIPLFSFPFNTGGTWYLSQYQSSDTVNIRNTGNVPFGFNVEFKLLEEPQPGAFISLQNVTTGVMLKIAPYGSLSMGDEIGFSSVENEKRILRLSDSMPLFHTVVDIDSFDINIVPGDNIIQFLFGGLTAECRIAAPQGVLSGV